MNEALFWNYIQRSGTEADHDTEQQISVLAEELENLEKQDLFAFGSFVDYYFEKAGQANLWNAGKVIIEDMEEEQFDNFRYWLILQGKEKYDGIFVDPDSLAENYGSEILEDILTQAENLGILADTVYENNTEKTDFYEKMEAWQGDNFELDFEEIDNGFLEDEIITDAEELENTYPKLSRKFF